MVEELTTNHLVDVQNMVMSIDTGYSDFEAEKWCKLFYFPSPMIPERNVSRRLLWWMYMESYESSIDAQTLDVKRLEIHTHFWIFIAIIGNFTQIT